jgi:hypothetical protein
MDMGHALSHMAQSHTLGSLRVAPHESRPQEHATPISVKRYPLCHTCALTPAAAAEKLENERTKKASEVGNAPLIDTTTVRLYGTHVKGRRIQIG